MYLGDEKIGQTTSGTLLPYLNKACAMALVEADKVAINTQVSVDVRGRRLNAVVVPMPFYKRT